MQVAALGSLGGEVAAALDIGLVGGRKVGRTADQVRNALGKLCQHLAASVAGRVLLVFKLPEGLIVFEVGMEAREPLLHFGSQFGIRLGVLLHHLVPLGFLLGALGRDLGGLLIDGGIDIEGLIGIHAEVFLERADIIHTQRLTVRGVLALLGRAMRADLGGDDDQRGAGILLGRLDRRAYGVDVLTVGNLLHMPAVGFVALGGIFAQRQLHLALDGDVVGVIEQDQLAQAQRRSQRGGFAGDPLHHAAVAHQRIGVVIDHWEAGAVKLGRQVLFRHRHADSVGNALTQRAGRGLHAHGMAVFGVAGGLGVELTEVLEIIHGQAVAEEMQQAIQHRGSVTGREHEAVAVAPLGIGGIVVHLLGPERVRHGRCTQRRAGVAGIGLLNRVRSQRTHRGDDFDIHVLHVFSSIFMVAA